MSQKYIWTNQDGLTLGGGRRSPETSVTNTVIQDELLNLPYGTADSGMSALQSRKLGNVLTKGFLGRFTTKANGADHTTSVQMTLEGFYDAVRIIIPNSVTSAIAGVKGRVSAGGAASSANSSGSYAPSDGGWPSFTWNGSSTVTLPAGTSVDNPSWTVSDWANLTALDRTDGGTLPLIWVRIYIPAAAANRPAYFYSAAQAAGITAWGDEASFNGRLFRPRVQAVDGATTLGTFNLSSTIAYDCVPFYLQYASRKTGLTIMVSGNSINEKAGSTPNARFGWQDIAQAAVSTLDAPIEFCTVAIGGSNAAAMLDRVTGCLPAIQPDYVTLSAFNVNNASQPITQANINTMRNSFSRALAVIREAGVVPIVETAPPASVGGLSGKTFGDSDSLRQNLNTDSTSDKRAVLDFASALSGPVTNGQVEYSADYTDDNLHPNLAGHSVMAARAAVPLVRRLMQANGLDLQTP